MSKDILWTSDQVIDATKGECNTNWQANAVIIDSRAVKQGSLFIALIGENHDAHKFVKQALDNGSAAAIVQYIPEDVPQDAPLVLVDDTTEALRNLGIYKRENTKAKVVGVTGSVAKTSTKEMIKCAFQALGKTHATEGNLNNHYGVPLSLSRMPDDTEYAVLEMGMNHAGEISQLTAMVRPHVAVITAVEIAHMEFFDDIHGIADAKAEIFEGLDKDGTAIINRDNPLHSYLERKVENLNIENCISFGEHTEANIRLLSYEVSDDIGVDITVTTGVKDYQISLPVIGKHQACNATCAVAVLHALKENIEQAVNGLKEFSLTQGRGVVHNVTCSGGGSYKIIDDCYNASPASIRAAVSVLKECKGRKVAILGDMLELGDEGPKLHEALAQDIKAAKIDKVYTVGQLMQNLYDALPADIQGKHYAVSSDFEPEVEQMISPGDVVLIKGSNGIKLRPLVEKLLLKEKVA